MTRGAASLAAAVAVPTLVVDTGVGNLGNLLRALDAVGGRAELSADPAAVAGAERLVLPGVGAFRPPRERLRGPLEDALRAAAGRGVPLLGICVGYQLLFESSDEFGETDGLGLLPGHVRRLEADRRVATVSLPQIGWNALEVRRAHPLFAGLGAGEPMYFVHTWAPVDVPTDAVLAEAVHGSRFTAVACRGSVAGTQFHPEKSGIAGLRLLRNFLDWRPAVDASRDSDRQSSGTEGVAA